MIVRRPRSPKGRARIVADRLAVEYPGSAKDLCALDHSNPYELLVATILSAQTTDVNVNKVTPTLFARYPTPEDLAAADPAEVEKIVQSTGFYRNKTKSIVGMANALVDRFKGQVPEKLSDLVTLPGVGRKTGNVVRSVAMDKPGLPVDTHVQRLSRRLGLTTQTDPVKIEMELNPLVRADERGALSLRLILHGRAICKARKPLCDKCVLADICPSAGTF
jgi:endonuclease-3